VHVTSPELVTVSPGVEVVADADEPLFYADGYYWLYRDDTWLRSDSYRGGFVRVDFAYVPQPIRTIQRPQVYAQYRRHHGGTMQARQTMQPQRSPNYNPGYRTPYPDQGVRSTPAPDTTWQPAQHQPPDVLPRPTPPVTSPNDVHGTPMPPGHTNLDDHDVTPNGEHVPPGQMRTPPAQTQQAPTPPAQTRMPPGQMKKQDQDQPRVPPGQEKKQDQDRDRDQQIRNQSQNQNQTRVPPGQAKKQDQDRDQQQVKDQDRNDQERGRSEEHRRKNDERDDRNKPDR
jgi:hypothetical protein